MELNIVMTETGCSKNEAHLALEQASGNVKIAIDFILNFNKVLDNSLHPSLYYS